MRQNRAFLKIIAVIVAGVFLHQQIVWAAGDMTGPVKPVPARANTARSEVVHDIRVPSDLAQLDEIGMNGSRDLIINIQDCHSSLSAQYSIVEILKRLLQDYSVDVVAIEGATGYVDTSILKTFPDTGIKEKTADYLMKEGKLSAGEFFTVTSNEDIALYGVEDNGLYRENVKVFRDIYSKNRESIDTLDLILEKLRKKEDKVYQEDLSRMVYKSRLHRDGKMSFDVYWDFLEEICRERGVPTGGYPAINGFMDCVSLERTIGFSEATSQRKELIDELMEGAAKEDLEEMVLKSLSFEKGKITELAYHTWLLDLAARKGARTEKYTQLYRYVDYIEHYQRLNIIGLQKELDRIEEKVLEELFSSQEERELYRLVTLVELVRALFEIKLSGEDVSRLSRNMDKVTVDEVMSFIGGKGTNDDQDAVLDIKRRLEMLLPEAKKALRFYKLAEKRNKAMLANTASTMRREGKHVAALISGGHHSRGLTELMKEKGLSYLVLMPKFSSDRSRPYIAVLTKKTGPYRELATSGAYDLALEAYFDKGDLDALEETLAFAVGQSVLAGKYTKVEIGEWLKAYEKAYEELEGSEREQALAAKAITPEDLRERLERLDVVSVDDGACEIKINGNSYRVTGEDVELIQPAIEGLEVRAKKYPVQAFRMMKDRFERAKAACEEILPAAFIDTVSRSAERGRIFKNTISVLKAGAGTGLTEALGGVALAWAARKQRSIPIAGTGDRVPGAPVSFDDVKMMSPDKFQELVSFYKFRVVSGRKHAVVLAHDDLDFVIKMRNEPVPETGEGDINGSFYNYGKYGKMSGVGRAEYSMAGNLTVSLENGVQLSDENAVLQEKTDSLAELIREDVEAGRIKEAKNKLDAFAEVHESVAGEGLVDKLFLTGPGKSTREYFTNIGRSRRSGKWVHVDTADLTHEVPPAGVPEGGLDNVRSWFPFKDNPELADHFDNQIMPRLAKLGSKLDSGPQPSRRSILLLVGAAVLGLGMIRGATAQEKAPRPAEGEKKPPIVATKEKKKEIPRHILKVAKEVRVPREIIGENEETFRAFLEPATYLVDRVLECTDSGMSAGYKKDVRFLLLMTALSESYLQGEAAIRPLVKFTPSTAKYLLGRIDARSCNPVFEQAADRNFCDNWKELVYHLPPWEIVAKMEEKAKKEGRKLFAYGSHYREFETFLMSWKVRELIESALDMDWKDIVAMPEDDIMVTLAGNDLFNMIMTRYYFWLKPAPVPSWKRPPEVYKYYVDVLGPGSPLPTGRFDELANRVSKSGVLDGIKGSVREKIEAEARELLKKELAARKPKEAKRPEEAKKPSPVQPRGLKPARPERVPGKGLLWVLAALGVVGFICIIIFFVWQPKKAGSASGQPEVHRKFAAEENLRWKIGDLYKKERFPHHFWETELAVKIAEEMGLKDEAVFLAVALYAHHLGHEPRKRYKAKFKNMDDILSEQYPDPEPGSGKPWHIRDKVRCLLKDKGVDDAAEPEQKFEVFCGGMAGLMGKGSLDGEEKEVAASMVSANFCARKMLKEADVKLPEEAELMLDYYGRYGKFQKAYEAEQEPIRQRCPSIEPENVAKLIAVIRVASTFMNRIDPAVRGGQRGEGTDTFYEALKFVIKDIEEQQETDGVTSDAVGKLLMLFKEQDEIIKFTLAQYRDGGERPAMSILQSDGRFLRFLTYTNYHLIKRNMDLIEKYEDYQEGVTAKLYRDWARNIRTKIITKGVGMFVAGLVYIVIFAWFYHVSPLNLSWVVVALFLSCFLVSMGLYELFSYWWYLRIAWHIEKAYEESMADHARSIYPAMIAELKEACGEADVSKAIKTLVEKGGGKDMDDSAKEKIFVEEMRKIATPEKLEARGVSYDREELVERRRDDYICDAIAVRIFGMHLQVTHGGDDWAKLEENFMERSIHGLVRDALVNMHYLKIREKSSKKVAEWTQEPTMEEIGQEQSVYDVRLAEKLFQEEKEKFPIAWRNEKGKFVKTETGAWEKLPPIVRQIIGWHDLFDDAATYMFRASWPFCYFYAFFIGERLEVDRYNKILKGTMHDMQPVATYANVRQSLKRGGGRRNEMRFDTGSRTWVWKEGDGAALTAGISDEPRGSELRRTVVSIQERLSEVIPDPERLYLVDPEELHVTICPYVPNTETVSDDDATKVKRIKAIESARKFGEKTLSSMKKSRRKLGIAFDLQDITINEDGSIVILGTVTNTVMGNMRTALEKELGQPQKDLLYVKIGSIMDEDITSQEYNELRARLGVYRDGGPSKFSDNTNKLTVFDQAQEGQENKFLKIEMPDDAESGAGTGTDKGAEPDRSLKAPEAGETDPVVEELIKDGRMVEVFERNGRLIAHRLRWVHGYEPGGINYDIYGEEIPIDEVFTKEQQVNMIRWIHSKGDLPDNRGRVRFRVVLNDTALGWESGEHSHICHAGYRDGCIYIGERLLGSVFSSPDDPLQKTLLDEDEYRHLVDPEFDCRADRRKYEKRLKEVDKRIGEIQKDPPARYQKICKSHEEAFQGGNIHLTTDDNVRWGSFTPVEIVHEADGMAPVRVSSGIFISKSLGIDPFLVKMKVWRREKDNYFKWIERKMDLVYVSDIGKGFVCTFVSSFAACYEGDYTFKYSVDGGKNWKWANCGPEDNRRIVRKKRETEYEPIPYLTGTAPERHDYEKYRVVVPYRYEKGNGSNVNLVQTINNAPGAPIYDQEFLSPDGRPEGRIFIIYDDEESEIRIKMEPSRLESEYRNGSFQGRPEWEVSIRIPVDKVDNETYHVKKVISDIRDISHEDISVFFEHAGLPEQVPELFGLLQRELVLYDVPGYTCLAETDREDIIPGGISDENFMAIMKEIDRAGTASERGVAKLEKIVRHARARHVEQTALEYLRVLVEAGEYNKESYLEHERYVREKDYYEDMANIERLVRRDRKFVEEMRVTPDEVRGVLIRWIASGLNKAVFRLTFRMKDGTERVAAVEVIGEPGLETGTSLVQLEKSARLWKEMSDAGEDYVPRVYAIRNIDDRRLVVASREFVEGYGLSEYRACAAVTDKEEREVYKAGLAAYFKMWRANRDMMTGRGQGLMDPGPYKFLVTMIGSETYHGVIADPEGLVERKGAKYVVTLPELIRDLHECGYKREDVLAAAKGILDENEYGFVEQYYDIDAGNIGLYDVGKGDVFPGTTYDAIVTGEMTANIIAARTLFLSENAEELSAQQTDRVRDALRLLAERVSRITPDRLPEELREKLEEKIQWLLSENLPDKVRRYAAAAALGTEMNALHAFEKDGLVYLVDGFWDDPDLSGERNIAWVILYQALSRIYDDEVIRSEPLSVCWNEIGGISGIMKNVLNMAFVDTLNTYALKTQIRVDMETIVVGRDLVEYQRLGEDNVSEARRNANEFVDTIYGIIRREGIKFEKHLDLVEYLTRRFGVRKFIIGGGKGTRFSPEGIVVKQVFKPDNYNTNIKMSRASAAFGKLEDVIVVDSITVFNILKEDMKISQTIKDRVKARVRERVLDMTVGGIITDGEKGNSLAAAMDTIIDEIMVYTRCPDGLQDLSMVVGMAEEKVDEIIGKEEGPLCQFITDKISYTIFREIIAGEEYMDGEKRNGLFGEDCLVVLDSGEGHGSAYIEALQELERRKKLGNARYSVIVHADSPGWGLDEYPNYPFIAYLKTVNLISPAEQENLPKVTIAAKTPFDPPPGRADGRARIYVETFPEYGPVPVRIEEWNQMTEEERRESREMAKAQAEGKISNWFTNANILIVETDYAKQKGDVLCGRYRHDLGEKGRQKRRPWEIWSSDLLNIAAEDFRELRKKDPKAAPLTRLISVGSSAPNANKTLPRALDYRDRQKEEIIAKIEGLGVDVDKDATIAISSDNVGHKYDMDDILSSIFRDNRSEGTGYGNIKLKGNIHLDATVKIGKGAILDGTKRGISLTGRSVVERGVELEGVVSPPEGKVYEANVRLPGEDGLLPGLLSGGSLDTVLLKPDDQEGEGIPVDFKELGLIVDESTRISLVRRVDRETLTEVEGIVYEGEKEIDRVAQRYRDEHERRKFKQVLLINRANDALKTAESKLDFAVARRYAEKACEIEVGHNTTPRNVLDEVDRAEAANILERIFGYEVPGTGKKVIDQIFVYGKVILDETARVENGTLLDGRAGNIVLLGDTCVEKGVAMKAVLAQDTFFAGKGYMDIHHYSQPAHHVEIPVFNSVFKNSCVECGAKVKRSSVKDSYVTAGAEVIGSDTEDEIVAGDEKIENRRLQKRDEILAASIEGGEYIPGAYRLGEKKEEDREEIKEYQLRSARKLYRMFFDENDVRDRLILERMMKETEQFIKSPAIDRYSLQQIRQFMFAKIRQNYVKYKGHPPGLEQFRPLVKTLRDHARMFTGRIDEITGEGGEIDLSNGAKVEQAKQVFRELAMLATRFNIIDFSMDPKILDMASLDPTSDEFGNLLDERTEKKLGIDGFARFEDLVFATQKGTFLYFTDNIGETEFDALVWDFLARMGHNVVIAAKDEFSFADIDVKGVDETINTYPALQKHVKDGRIRVIKSGSKSEGAFPHEFSEEVLSVLKNEAPLAIIAKGQANAFTLSARNNVKFPVVTMFLSKSITSKMITGVDRKVVTDEKGKREVCWPIIAVVPAGQHIMDWTGEEGEFRQEFARLTSSRVHEEVERSWAGFKDVMEMSPPERWLLATNKRYALSLEHINVHQEHVKRVSAISRLIAERIEEIGSRKDLMNILQAAADIHDGQCLAPDEITAVKTYMIAGDLGTGKLTSEERKRYSNVQEFIDRVNSAKKLKGSDLSKKEVDAARDMFDHGGRSVEDIKAHNAGMPLEVEILVRHHQFPSEFFAMQEVYRDQLSGSPYDISVEDLGLMLMILYTADAFETGNNADRMRFFRDGRPPETFDATFKFLREAYKKEKITEKRLWQPFSVLEDLIKERNENVISMALDARGGEHKLQQKDIKFINKLRKRKRRGHPFNAASARRWGWRFIVPGFAGCFTVLALYSMGSISGITYLLLTGAFGYMVLGSLRYFLLSRAVRQAWIDFVLEGRGPEDRTPEDRERIEEAMEKEIAYRRANNIIKFTDAFGFLSPRAQKLVRMHEEFRYHWTGMLALLPVFGTWFIRGIWRLYVHFYGRPAVIHSDYSNMEEVIEEQLKRNIKSGFLKEEFTSGVNAEQIEDPSPILKVLDRATDPHVRRINEVFRNAQACTFCEVPWGSTEAMRSMAENWAFSVNPNPVFSSQIIAINSEHISQASVDSEYYLDVFKMLKGLKGWQVSWPSAVGTSMSEHMHMHMFERDYPAPVEDVRRFPREVVWRDRKGNAVVHAVKDYPDPEKPITAFVVTANLIDENGPHMFAKRCADIEVIIKDAGYEVDRFITRDEKGGIRTFLYPRTDQYVMKFPNGMRRVVGPEELSGIWRISDPEYYQNFRLANTHEILSEIALDPSSEDYLKLKNSIEKHFDESEGSGILPSSMDLMVTHECNLNCPICWGSFMPRHGMLTPDDKKIRWVDFENAKVGYLEEERSREEALDANSDLAGELGVIRYKFELYYKEKKGYDRLARVDFADGDEIELKFVKDEEEVPERPSDEERADIILRFQKRMIDIMYENGMRRMIFTGGEPLLADLHFPDGQVPQTAYLDEILAGDPIRKKNLAELLKHAKDVGVYTTWLFTNATLLDEEKADEIMPYVDIISLSLDGHDEQTSTRARRPGHFGAVMRSLDILRHKYPDKNIQVLTVVTAQNKYYIRRIGLLLREATKGLKSFQWKLNYYKRIGRSQEKIDIENDRYFMSYDEYRDLAESIKREFNPEKGTDEAIRVEYEPEDDEDVKSIKVRISPSEHDKAYLFVFPDGMLATTVGAEYLELGNILSPGTLKNEENVRVFREINRNIAKRARVKSTKSPDLKKHNNIAGPRGKALIERLHDGLESEVKEHMDRTGGLVLQIMERLRSKGEFADLERSGKWGDFLYLVYKAALLEDIGVGEKHGPAFRNALNRVNRGIRLHPEDRVEPTQASLTHWAGTKALSYEDIPRRAVTEALMDARITGDYYHVYKLYVKCVILGQGADEDLSSEEETIARLLYSHGKRSVEILREKEIDFPLELELLLTYHHDYNSLERRLNELVSGGDLTAGQADNIRLAATVLIVADVFEMGNNSKRMKMRGHGRAENFGETLDVFNGYIWKRFNLTENIGDTRAIEALKETLSIESQGKVTMNLAVAKMIAGSRGLEWNGRTDWLTQGDIRFMQRAAEKRRRGEKPVLGVEVVVGLPSNVYDGLHRNDREDLRNIPGVSTIIRVDSSGDEESMLRELAEKTRGGKSISALISPDVFPRDWGTRVDRRAVASELKKLVADFAGKARDNVIELTSSERVNELTEEGLQAIREIDSLRDIMGILVRRAPNCRSYRLSELSISQVRVEDAFDGFYTEDHTDTNRIEYQSKTLGNVDRHYLAHYADGRDIVNGTAPAIVPPGLEIQRRRQRQNVSHLIDPYQDKFFIVAPEKDMDEERLKKFKEMVMDYLMLNGVVGEEDVIVLPRKDEKYRASELYRKLGDENEGVTKTNTGIRCLSAGLEYDPDAEKMELLQVDLEKGSSHNINQYEAFVNLLISRGEGDEDYLVSGTYPRFRRERKTGLYYYIPRVKAVALEDEIRAYYDRYRREVLIKA